MEQTPKTDVMRAAYLEARRHNREPSLDGPGVVRMAERFAAPATIVTVLAPLGFKLGRAVKVALASRRQRPVIIEDGDSRMPDAA